MTHRVPTLLATGNTDPGVVDAMKYPKALGGSWRALTLRSLRKRISLPKTVTRPGAPVEFDTAGEQ
jgi:hypothetical protein